MTGIAILCILAALVLGIAAGWLAWGRGAAAVSRERDEMREKFGRAVAELAGAQERAKQVENVRADLSESRRTLDEYRSKAGDAERDLAAMRAGQEERERAAAAQLQQLIEAREGLSRQFGEVGAKLLEEAQRQFLERADQRFKQSEEKSGVELKSLLVPVTERLQRYEEGVAKIEVERREAYGNLTGLMESMRAGQDAVRNEAAKLVNSLRNAPKSRGRWGEQQLKNVLETCGLSEHCDFQTEVSIGREDGDGRLRPDAIIKVPGGRALVIDAKVSLNAYQDAFGAVDDAERRTGLAAHASAMKAHVNGLSAKAYWSQFAQAPDYVIMFVPGEHFLSAALDHDPTLWDFAFDKRVLLATPTNLIAIARTVAAVWRQEKLADEARKIGELGKAMYDRLAIAAGHLKSVGGGLTSAVNHYNKFVSSFETRVLVTGREFQKLNIETGAKQIEEVPAVEVLARYGEGELLADPAREAAE